MTELNELECGLIGGGVTEGGCFDPVPHDDKTGGASSVIAAVLSVYPFASII